MKILISCAILALTPNLVQAGIKQNTDTCINKCYTERESKLADLDEGEEKTKTQDEYATFYMCVKGEATDKDGNALPGTPAEGMEQSETCIEFLALEDPTDETVHDWRNERQNCYNESCKESDEGIELEMDTNKDWIECMELCEGETYAEEKIKTLFYCFNDCKDEVKQDLGQKMQSGLTEADANEHYIMPFMYAQQICFMEHMMAEHEDCVSLGKNWNDWDHPKYLEYRKSCQSECTDAPEGTEYSDETLEFLEGMFDCQATCVEDSGIDVDYREIADLFKDEEEESEKDDDASSAKMFISASMFVTTLLAII